MSQKKTITCPACGEKIGQYKNPIPTVDIIIEIDKQYILIERRNKPFGWAIPGGFVDYGESVEDAAIREAWEETSLRVELTSLLGVYSKPDRDPRLHTIATVFLAKAVGKPEAGDDAKTIRLFRIGEKPDKMVFDHDKIIEDYFIYKKIKPLRKNKKD